MAVYTYEVATEYNFPNLTVYKSFKDGVHNGWRINANEGYVYYDTAANDMDFDPETEEMIPVTYYYTVRHCPLNYNFNNFTLVAVPRDSVDENLIFGGGDNDHETI
jgi:hypothetical protein